MEFSPYFVIPALTLVIKQLLNLLKSESIKNIQWSTLLDFKSQPDWLSVMIWSTLPVTYFVHGINAPWFVTNLLIGLVVMRLQAEGGATLKQRLQTLGFGLLSGTLLSVKYWQDDLDWLLGRPSDAESRVYLIIFAVILVVGEFLAIRMRRSDLRKLPTARRLQRTFRITLSFPAIFGLLVALLQNQTRNDFLTDRIYVYLALVWIVVGTVWAYQSVYKNAKLRLAEEKEHFVKEKKKTKKKKRKSKRR